jgi:hypothetical protein
MISLSPSRQMLAQQFIINNDTPIQCYMIYEDQEVLLQHEKSRLIWQMLAVGANKEKK